MSASAKFDPYRKWLGIPPAEQPPNHYRLLGVGLFEDDADTIAIAADRQMAHIRTFQAGPNSALSQTLLNELAAARLVLLDAKKKAAYDEQLRAKLPESATAADRAGQGSGAPVDRPMPVPKPVAILPPPTVSPTPVVPFQPPKVGQSSGGAAGYAPAAAASEMPFVASPMSRRVRRSRPELAMWLGVMAAIVVLAAVIYFAREQFKEEANAVAMAAKKSSPRASAEPDSIADNDEQEPTKTDSAGLSEPDLSTSLDGPTDASATMLDAAPAVEESGDSSPSPGPGTPADSTSKQRPAAAKPPSLTDLLDAAGRPRLEPRRRDVPPEGKALVAANARFARLYGEEMTNAKTPAALAKLSFRFFHLAREGASTADVRYVLLGASGTSAANRGNVGLAYRVAAEMSRQFDVEPYTLKLKALEAAAKNASRPAANAVAVLQALTLAERAAAEGKGDLASKAASQAVLSARKTKDKQLMAQADQAKAALREHTSRHAVYQTALTELKKNPENSEANLAAGKYETLVLGDWPAGLVKLAGSGDERFAAIARGEAEARVDPSRWAPLASAWWQAAETEEDGFFKLQCRLQAKYCYLRAKTFGRSENAPAELAEQLNALPGYPASRMRPGAAARYYEGDNFARQRVDRVEQAIDFNFGEGSPDPSIPNDFFSARWSGFFKPPLAGRYSIITYTDDSARLWVDGKQVLNRWHQVAARQQVDLELTAELHTFRYEYNEAQGAAFALLGWTLAAFPEFPEQHLQHWTPIDSLCHDPESPFDLPELR